MVSQKICRKLDLNGSLGGGYRELAAHFIISNDDIRRIAQHSNPTDNVLALVGRNRENTIGRLREILKIMRRDDCLSIIDQSLQSGNVLLLYMIFLQGILTAVLRLASSCQIVKSFLDGDKISLSFIFILKVIYCLLLNDLGLGTNSLAIGYDYIDEGEGDATDHQRPYRPTMDSKFARTFFNSIVRKCWQLYYRLQPNASKTEYLLRKQK